jgi:hypothetical protein
MRAEEREGTIGLGGGAKRIRFVASGDAVPAMSRDALLASLTVPIEPGGRGGSKVWPHGQRLPCRRNRLSRRRQPCGFVLARAMAATTPSSA